MYFTAEQQATLLAGLATVSAKRTALTESYVSHPFQNPEASEYARHGYARRLKTLDRSIERVFEIMPPNREDIPTADEISDVTIYIQASIFNVFASIDNLAWVFVRERPITRPDGSPIPNSWVGLAPTNSYVRDALSAELRGYLEQDHMREWFEHLENFRHALAHRIPLYIPPYTIHPDNGSEYANLEAQEWDSLRAGNWQLANDLKTQKSAMMRFQPIMVHSLNQDSPVVVFHAQLLANFNTVVELGEKMIAEFGSNADGTSQ